MGGVAGLGDAGLREILAPAEEETHLYLEVFGAAVTGLRLRRDFLPGVFLATAATGRLPLPVWADDVDAAATLTGEGDTRLACFCSAPPSSCLFFTQVNWDVLTNAAPTWSRLLRQASLQEGSFDDLGNGAAGGLAILAEADGLAAFLVSLIVLLMSKALVCRFWGLIDEGAARETFFGFSFSPGSHF